MNNIFENAYFGKAYKTRDGRKAIYIGYNSMTNYAMLVIEHFDPSLFDSVAYYTDGTIVMSETNNHEDIVSEWEEPINEEKLDDLAYDYNEERQPNYWWEDDGTDCVCEASEVREAFKAGYKTAKKGE